MLEKLKNIFKEKNKKIENLIAFLVILIITLIIINNIIKDDDKKNKTDYTNAELATTNLETNISTDLERKLENILSKIDGVGDVTYSESSTIIPIYNETNKKSITEEKDTSGGTRTIESQDNDKSVVTTSDSNPVTQKTINPTIEGAIVTAKGAGNANIKSNIVLAVEAVTGLATHKIQVFEMKN